jgi:hypothetical protein
MAECGDLVQRTSNVEMAGPGYRRNFVCYAVDLYRETFDRQPPQ